MKIMAYRSVMMGENRNTSMGMITCLSSWRFSLLLMVLLLVVPSSQALTITVGKGSGILWEGMPFSFTYSSKVPDGVTSANYPVMGLVPAAGAFNSCLTTSNGFGGPTYMGQLTRPFGQGVGLIPRATVTASYVRYDGTPETLTGTIGLPQGGATTSGGAIITNPYSIPNYGTNVTWCLPPAMSNITNFYKPDSIITSTISGTWVIVGDGSQINATLVGYGNYVPLTVNGRMSDIALPIIDSVRITSLLCSVATTTTINFGNVQRNTQSGAELAKLIYPLTTSCTQDAASAVNANINVQFRAISGLYGSAPTRLALTQGGGYITGEIDNGVTGSGVCTGASGIPFDNTQLKVGSITSAQTSQTTSNQVTWRLCSGGSSLPVGAVNASAEMLVTLN